MRWRYDYHFGSDPAYPGEFHADAEGHCDARGARQDEQLTEIAPAQSGG